MHSTWDKFTLDHSKSKSDKIPTGFMIFIHALCFVKVSKCFNSLKNAIFKNKKKKLICLRHVWTYQQTVVNRLVNGILENGIREEMGIFENLKNCVALHVCIVAQLMSSNSYVSRKRSAGGGGGAENLNWSPLIL